MTFAEADEVALSQVHEKEIQTARAVVSVIIVFPSGTDWFKANWVFRQLAQDLSTAFPSDSEVNCEMEKAEALGALFLKDINEPLRSRVAERLRAVAEGTLDGKIEGWRKHDASGRRMYLASLSELLNLLSQQ